MRVLVPLSHNVRACVHMVGYTVGLFLLSLAQLSRVAPICCCLRLISRSCPRGHWMRLSLHLGRGTGFLSSALCCTSPFSILSWLTTVVRFPSFNTEKRRRLRCAAYKPAWPIGAADFGLFFVRRVDCPAALPPYRVLLIRQIPCALLIYTAGVVIVSVTCLCLRAAAVAEQTRLRSDEDAVGTGDGRLWSLCRICTSTDLSDCLVYVVFAVKGAASVDACAARLSERGRCCTLAISCPCMGRVEHV